MADEQVIKIRFATQNEELKESRRELQGLSKDEQQLVKDFRAINAAANSATAAIQNVGKKADASMKQASKSTKDATKELDILGSTATKVGASIAAFFTFQAVANLTKQIIEVTAEYEKFRAVLINTLGSEGAADQALSLISDFAATTNFSVQELTSAFIKLTNSGFQPTKEELTLLADVANSTGKSFDQLTEAILDANTFQFERLKEFGIKAETAGNKIRFTFKGVTTEVAKTSDSVQQYLLGLGKLQGVAGSTAAISATLTGQISNLGDSYDQLLLSIGKQGRGGVSEAISFLSTILGELKKAVEGEKSAFDPFVQTLNGLWSIVTDLTSSISNLWSEFQNLFGEVKEGDILMQGLAYTFKVTLLPIKALIQGVIITVDAFKTLGTAATNAGILVRNAFKSGPGQPLFDLGIDKLKADAIKLIQIASLTDGELKRVKKDSDNKDIGSTSKREKKKTELTKEEIDKRFKAELDNLDKLEQLAIREAKLRIEDNEEEQREVLRIESEYQQKRIAIVKAYGRQNEIVGKENALKQLEIFDQQALYEIEAERKKQEELAKIRDARKAENLAAIDDIGARQKLSRDKLTQDEIEAAQQRYMSSNDITKRGEEYEKQLKEINYNATRKNIESEIDLLEEKKNVKGQSDQEILKLDQQIQEDKVKLLDMEYQKFKETEDKKTAAAKAAHDQRVQIAQAGLQLGVEIINAQFQITSQNIQAELDALQNKSKEDQRLVGDNAKKKAEIENQARIREAQLRRKQAENERNAALFNIAVNTAQNVVKAYGTPPVPNFVLAGIALASGLAQASVVSSRPIPKFAKGSKGVTGGIEGQDSVMAMLMPGEKVIPTKQSRGPMGPILDGIIDGKIKRADLTVKGMDYSTDKLGGAVVVNDNSAILLSMDRLNKSVSNLKQVHIGIDRNGLNVFQKTQNAKTKFENRYFRG